MKIKYRITTVIIVVVICIVVICSYLLSYEKIGNIYSEQTREVIFDLRKSFLKDTVNNLIYEIEAKRETKAEHYKRIVDRRQKILEEKVYLSDDEFVEFFINQCTNESNPDLWTAFIWNNKDNKAVYDPKNLYKDKFNTTLETLKDRLSSYGVINHGYITGIFGVSKNYIDESVKSEIIEKIRTLKFDHDSYIWINEVVNYDGGADYAIRRVHPNLLETEGMYLSTDMTDIKGNLPYLEELEGVKKKGELFFTYYFKRLNNNVISEKLTYAKLYKDYDWIIAMGVHLDDIQAYIDTANVESKALASELTIKLILSLLAILVFGFILLIFIENRYFISSKKKLEFEVNQDPLTKASSRRCGTNDLITAFKDYKIKGTSPGIMIFDIDNFKRINDKYGHDFGDRVLIEIVQAVYHIIRSSDKLIRWGGDEFIGIFYGLKEENIIELGEKILSAVSSLKIPIGSETVSPTVSAGFSYFKESDKDFKAALKRADEALYKSKVEGKNRINIII